MNIFIEERVREMYLDELILPSKGIPYGSESGVKEKIYLRPITTTDEKSLYGSAALRKIIDNLIKNCTMLEQDKGTVDPDIITMPDKTAILIKLRSISFGRDYYYSYKCSCGNENKVKVDLEELPVNFLDKKNYNLDITLKKCEDVVTFKYLTGRDFNYIKDEAEKRSKRLKTPLDEELVFLRFAALIEKVNGKALTFDEKVDYYSKMSMIDVSWLRHCISKIDYGVDTDIKHKCSCGNENIHGLDITIGNFFRTQFDE
jgi:hypothetical protein